MGCNCNKGIVKQTIEKIIGETFVEKNVQDNRLAICSRCIFYELTVLNMKQCRKCGCFLEAKTQILEQKCPVGKW